MTGLLTQLREIIELLNGTQNEWALVGALAVGIRSEVRTTRDSDIAVLAPDEESRETLVQFLEQRGFQNRAKLFHAGPTFLMGTQLTFPTSYENPVAVDLLFRFCGFEDLLVSAAQPVEIFPGVTAPVATLGHLIATKAISSGGLEREQDIIDLRNLLSEAGDDTLAEAREALAAARDRGFPIEGSAEERLEKCHRKQG